MTPARDPAAAAPRTLQVLLGERSYHIHLGVGTLATTGEAIARHTKASRVAVITVPAIGRRYPCCQRTLPSSWMLRTVFFNESSIA